MGTLSVDSNLSFTCRDVFMKKYFLHNGCTFNRKKGALGKGSEQS